MADAITLPDLWQLEALRALRGGEDLVIQAPTGAGKTLVFERWLEGGFRGQAVYAVPTRALANDKHAEWTSRGWDVGIATGDVGLNLRAPVLVATLETQRQRFLANDPPAFLAVDEYQMLADPSRGGAYETVLGLAPVGTQLLLLSGSVANPGAIADWLRGRGRNVRLIEENVRPVPLEEISLDALERRAPAGARGSTARAIQRALQADLGPVLVFAPRRRAAAQLAEEIAASLPLDAGPTLSPSQRALAGDDLARLIRHGVGLHHSGLTYEQRSGLVEPLAKAGALRVVVATTGLAAGINFSLRSVLVTDRRYVSGHSLREIRPDELLQMFGRAGRRGLDDRGFALWTADSPRLGEARPLQLRRSDNLDWPAFLQRMAGAKDPIAVAESMAATLFTKDPVDLALRDLPADEEPASPSGGVAPMRTLTEMQGRDGTWQRVRPTRQVSLGEALIRVGASWHPALEKPDSLRALPFGTPCRLEMTDGSTRHGRMVPLAHFPKSGGRDTLEPLGWLSKALRAPAAANLRRPRWTLESIERDLIPILPALTQGGVAHGPPFLRQDTVFVRLDYSRANVRVTPDADDNPLINPLTRTVERADILLGEVLGGGQAKGGRAGRLWLRLGLIDRFGKVTRRGEIASRFQHGEGLAVAAALEDTGYPAETLAWDLAELRAGERVGASSRSTSRLAACSRLAYRSLSAEGYLREGLPESFGEGSADVLRQFALHSKLPAGTEDGQGAGRGDLERALLEWRSTLRLVADGEDHPWERWQDLRAAAAKVLAEISQADK